MDLGYSSGRIQLHSWPGPYFLCFQTDEVKDKKMAIDWTWLIVGLIVGVVAYMFYSRQSAKNN